jgi:hypothetical protein
MPINWAKERKQKTTKGVALILVLDWATIKRRKQHYVCTICVTNACCIWLEMIKDFFLI